MGGPFFLVEVAVCSQWSTAANSSEVGAERSGNVPSVPGFSGKGTNISWPTVQPYDHAHWSNYKSSSLTVTCVSHVVTIPLIRNKRE